MLLSLSSNTGNVYVQTHFWHVFIIFVLKKVFEWENKYINIFVFVMVNYRKQWPILVFVLFLRV